MKVMAWLEDVASMVIVQILFILQTLLLIIAECVWNPRFWAVFLGLGLPSYMFVVRHFRYERVKMIKKRYGFTDDLKSYKDMTPDVAQAVLKNLAEWDFPFVFEFGWISEFFKTATAPCLSKVIVETGHFTSTDPLLSHGRQQATVALMTQMQVQPLHTREHAIAMARINIHHVIWAARINSDTVLWLSWMWMQGPVQWINLIGWRKLYNFEIHAMFIYWREMSVMMGCKWVPNTLAELESFRLDFEAKEQKFSHWNATFSDAMLDAILFAVPGFLKSLGRKCLIAVLDMDVRRCNGYAKEFDPRIRSILLFILKAWGLFQRYFCLPRMSPRILTATTNPDGTVNFPEYTYPATPYYVKQTLMNQYSPFAILNRLRGLPIPAPQFGSNGVTWESMGAKQPIESRQLRAEQTVLLHYPELMNGPWGFRSNLKYQYKSIAVTRHMGPGYGSPVNAYKPDALVDE